LEQAHKFETIDLVTTAKSRQNVNAENSKLEQWGDTGAHPGHIKKFST